MGSPSHTTEQWFAEFDTARSLGAPTSGVEVTDEVHRRDFAARTVLVNPTAFTRTVALEGTSRAPA